MAKVDIFQNGEWVEALVVSEDGDDLAYLEPGTNVLVQVKKSALPYKNGDEAQAVRDKEKHSGVTTPAVFRSDERKKNNEVKS